jgi:hypothetical protein
MSASHLPEDDSISLRDMEAGGSTLESGSSGFSVSDGFAANVAKLPVRMDQTKTEPQARRSGLFRVLALGTTT